MRLTSSGEHGGDWGVRVIILCAGMVVCAVMSRHRSHALIVNIIYFLDLSGSRRRRRRVGRVGRHLSSSSKDIVVVTARTRGCSMFFMSSYVEINK